MKRNIFHPVTVNGGESDNAGIVKVFSKMATGQLPCDLKLLNYCGEMPVSYDFTVTNVDKDNVELAVHEHQALIIKHDRYTLIKNEHFHNELGVHCHAKHVNVPKKTVILHNFSYAKIRSEQREALRVKVNEPLLVRFSCENVNFEGRMLDISENGISINSDYVQSMKTEQLGLLSFKLDSTPLKVFGSLVKSTTNGTDGHIYIFQLKPDSMSGSIIDRFISLRQTEIIQDLKLLFSE